MFPELTTRRPNKRSLRELVRGAVGTALEFATLGEATLGSVDAGGSASRPRPVRSTWPAARTAGDWSLSHARAAAEWSARAPRSAARRCIPRRHGGPDRRTAPGLGGRERRTAWRPPRGAGLHRLSGRPSPGGPSALRAPGPLNDDEPPGWAAR